MGRVAFDCSSVRFFFFSLFDGKSSKVTCDESGVTYYDSDSASALRNPLGFIDSVEILTVCDMGNMKKKDNCIEVITKDRT